MASNGIRVRGITIEIKGDVSGLVDSFKKVDAQLKRTKNNLGAISDYIVKDTSWNTLHNKFNALTLQQELMKTQEDELIKKIRLEQEALGTLAEADQTPQVTERAQALKTQIILDTNELRKLQDQMKEFGTVAQQKMNAVGQAIKATGEKISDVGRSMTATGRSLSMYVTAPIVGIGTAAMKSSVEFEAAMDKVQSVTVGATTEDIERLSQAVLDMSGKSKYSAAEASEALYYMGLAGWNVEEMLAALPDVLAVATAGEMDLGRASDIVTDYFTAFGEGAGTVEHMVDVMARTMVSSNTDIDQLGDAFKYVAPVAGAMGYTIEDVSFALGLMANNGIKASQAGTSLRQFMQRLVKPTKEVQTAMDELGITVSNSDGSIKSFREVMDDLRVALGDVFDPAGEAAQAIASLNEQLEEGEITEEEYSEALEDVLSSAKGVTGAEKAKNAAILAGVRGMSGLLAIVNATEQDYKELSDAIEGTTTAQDIANVMIDNTQGRMEILKHSAENLGISFGKVMAPYIEKGISALGGLVQKFSELDDGTKDTIVRIAGIAAAVGPLLVVIGSVINAVGTITSAVGSLVSFIAMNPLSIPIAALVVTLGAAVATAIEAEKEMDAQRQAVWGLSEEYKQLVTHIGEAKDAYDKENIARAETAAAIDTETGYLQNLQDELSTLIDENGRVKDGYQERVDFILNELNNALGTEYERTADLIKGYQAVQEEITNLIEKKRQEMILEQGRERYDKAIQNQQEAYHNYTEAVAALEEQQKKTAEAEATMVEWEQKLAASTRKTGREYYALRTHYNKAKEDYETAINAERDLQQAVNDSAEIYAGIQNDIENYHEAYKAAISGSTEAAKDAMDMLLYDFKRFDTSTREQLEDQVVYYKKMYDQAKKDVAAGVAGVSQATIDEYARMVQLSEKELEKFGKGSADAVKSGIQSVDMSGPGSEHVNQYVKGLESGKDASYNAAALDARSAKAGFASVDASQSGKNFGQGIADGIKFKSLTVQQAAEHLASVAKTGFNKPVKIMSPSKVMMESGKFFDEGIAIGIEKNADMVVSQAEALSRETAAAFATNTASPFYGMAGGASSLSNKTWNLGGVSINITQQPGENVDDLTDRIMDRFYREVQQRQAVYA